MYVLCTFYYTRVYYYDALVTTHFETMIVIVFFRAAKNEVTGTSSRKMPRDTATVHETVNKSEPLTKVIGHLLNYILSVGRVSRALKSVDVSGRRRRSLRLIVLFHTWNSSRGMKSAGVCRSVNRVVIYSFFFLPKCKPLCCFRIVLINYKPILSLISDTTYFN